MITGDGQSVAAYSYDPYGKILTSTGSMATINPLCYRSYVYDAETGFYYLQSRYYDPSIGRFINADRYVSTDYDIIGNNMFSYCGNNPVVRSDYSGESFETVWDIFSLGSSIIEVTVNPSNPWAWIALAGDVIDVLVPGVGGVGELAKAAGKIIDGFGDLSKAAKYGIKAYNELRNSLYKTGLFAHHIIEQRLVKHLGINLNKMLSVAVTAAEHQKFTNAWRELFKYGMDYSNITIDDLWEAAQKIYKNYPEILKAAKKILYG